MTDPSDGQVLVVARAHGTTIAAVWSGRSPVAVVALRKRADGYSRGRGHPSKAEMDAMAPRSTCRCQRCAEHRDLLAERTRRASAAAAAHHDTRRRRAIEARPDDWQSHGLCVGLPTHIWFPATGESQAAPKAICDACPARDACLDHALTNGEHYGIWGGTSERERRRMRRSTAA